MNILDISIDYKNDGRGEKNERSRSLQWCTLRRVLIYSSIATNFLLRTGVRSRRKLDSYSPTTTAAEGETREKVSERLRYFPVGST